jgi:thiol-disulfide isomerase/thioredoxin
MKKILYGFLALASLAMVSCSQEVDEQINANTDSVKKVFTANTEDGASTRTSIALEEETGNYVVIWNGEEQIAVNGVAYKVIDGANTKSVKFGAATDGVEAATAEVYNAVYPFESWSSEGVLNLEPLANQTAKNATYGHGYAVTVSTTTKSEMDFKFKNALSFLRVRFKLADDAKEEAITIKNVKITANDNLWGVASDVNYATGEIGAVANDNEAGKRIVYAAGEDVVLSKGEVFDAVMTVPVNTDGRTLKIEVSGENAWTGTPYTYVVESVTKKYLRNTVTTLTHTITPEEVQYVAEGVIRNNEGEWIISNVAGMEWFREQVESGKNVFKGQVVKLGDNIDLASVANFAPISYENYFEGTFDGQSYTISNLNIARENDWCLGLFGAVKGATFKNIVFENASVTISNSNEAEGNGGMFGLLCGYSVGTTTIDNITVKGTVKLQGETTHQGGQRIGTMVGVTEGNLNISNVKINVDENQDIANTFEISSIPCLILFKDGEEVDRAVGFRNKQQLQEFLNKSR